jgi:hypothetical protein
MRSLFQNVHAEWNRRAKVMIKVAALAMWGAAISWGGQAEVVIRVLDNGKVPGAVAIEAQNIASKLLASAGVRLRWQYGAPKNARTRGGEMSGAPETIDLRFVANAPKELPAAAMAAAFPFARSGVRIAVFFDRVTAQIGRFPISRGLFLGHVLAHEIGHMLCGTNGHTSTGLMKACWTEADYIRMRGLGLGFTSGDLELIGISVGRGL